MANLGGVHTQPVAVKRGHGIAAKWRASAKREGFG
jgi:hypothetical protein